MSQLTEIILKAGILSPEALSELKKWRLPVGDVDPSSLSEFSAPPTPKSISEAIATAIEDEGYVLTRETDLEAIPQYLETMKPAVLHAVLEDGETAEFEVHVGKTATGDWIMPWRSETITDILANGETYLRHGGKRIYFSQARELFYGQRKAFVVCTPATVEASNGAS